MGREMVIESWFGSSWWNPRKSASESTDKVVLGILAFEVTRLMSKVVNLWHALDDREILKLREEIADSIGIQRLVSDDENYLMDLALNEVIENFGNLAKSVARLGKKCTDPVYRRFEHFINDPILNNFEWFGWEYRWKKMERKVKKMERFVAVTMQLTQELEVLAELEQTLRRMQRNAESDRVKLLESQQKVMWQRQEVKNLREMSPWIRTYDYIVRLLLRSLLTILERIKIVFGTNQMATVDGNNDFESMNSDCLSRSHSFSTLIPSSVYPSDNNICGFSSGPLGRTFSKSVQITHKYRTNSKHLQCHHQSTALHGKHQHLKIKRSSHVGVGPFKGCLSAGSDSPILESCKPIGTGSMRFSRPYTKTIDNINNSKMESSSCSNKIYSKLSIFNTKCLLNAPPSTLGDAALALRYANVIILIEKLVSSPHLIGHDARDDLYNMLPTTMRNALRVKLKSYAKTLASFIYDASLAAEWSLALVRILEWLAPLAHNMIRWQSERNFEEQHVVSRSNVLLVQTLYFANQAKTEAAITELLVGLNYVYRIERAHNEKAVHDSAGSGGCTQYLIKRDDIR
ncbi:PREDICTED: uncharacterized protein LOC18598143 [Theobroma cacao]|uniref:Uncharacterized protein LOC18598143 n=1 Tax=Theobroma cacao TaxID=3641 RepID=A0AB32V3M1_THECC|nr:PREDICTED: uncharacterized protein LOC18598143 [Theobroma cacao]XP_007027594.2 PREDICTED: uncharacterized protein LOC18598143 [Theobroma cacao]